MSRKPIPVILLFGALLALGFSAQPTYAAGVIGGVVIDAAGNPVPNALVTIQQMDVRRGQRPYAVRVASGRDGTYVFRNVPPGRYTVTAATRRATVSVEVGLRDNGALRVRLVLQARGGGNERD